VIDAASRGSNASLFTELWAYRRRPRPLYGALRSTLFFEVIMSQRVLITGAASGIGLEIARAFSAASATVFITDINAQALTASQQEVPGNVRRRVSKVRRLTTAEASGAPLRDRRRLAARVIERLIRPAGFEPVRAGGVPDALRIELPGGTPG
jgi:hypothetical protein